jgi:hypothetical protein
VHAGTVGVAVNHEADAGAAEYGLDGGRVDVGDVVAGVREVLAAAFARLGCESAPSVDRQAREPRAQRGIAHQRAQLLVCTVVDAEPVAVADRDTLVRDGQDGRVVEQRRAGLAAEAVAEHEIAIAPHHVDERAGGRQRREPCDHFAV